MLRWEDRSLGSVTINLALAKGQQPLPGDDWQIHYAVTKRRAGKAPEGSGVPVGTEYNWYILAHQNVKKLNANDYSTEMTGKSKCRLKCRLKGRFKCRLKDKLMHVNERAGY